MESHADPENQVMVEDGATEMMEIDPKKARFPCCIVWTPLPVLSWLVPFIGHIGVCREDGVILDFAGPNFVCVDNFSFGSVARYIQFSKEKDSTWDTALHNSTREYQHLSYNLLTCNCHSFVANTLNRLRFHGNGWNVVNLAAMIFIKGKWVNKAAIMRSFLPFVIVFGIGISFWGLKFLTFLTFFTFVLTGWFLLGTYCFKNMIHL